MPKSATINNTNVTMLEKQGRVEEDHGPETENKFNDKQAAIFVNVRKDKCRLN